MLPELTEGHGIAARHPGDVGIAEDPAVVFADGFEDLEDVAMDTSAYPQQGRKWDSAWGIVRVTQEPENVHSGKQAVEIWHRQPMRSHGVEKCVDPGFDVLFVRYYMKYAAEYPGCHHTGVAIHGAAPGVNYGSSTGVRPDGRNHFTALLDTVPPWTHSSPGPPGYMDIYCYHMDQNRKWGDVFFPDGVSPYPDSVVAFGECFVPRPKIMAERGRWYCYELMVRANAPGARDGRVAFWVDGKLAGDFPNLRLRSVPSLRANRVILSSYSSTRHANQALWYDDVVVATSYIGPQVALEPR